MNTLALTPQAAATQVQRASAYAAPTPAPSGSTDKSTITSSDFLTLLVTQLKSQDPTQPVDPAAYVQQLVGVNSLEQLIDVNKQLTSLGGSLAATKTSANG